MCVSAASGRRRQKQPQRSVSPRTVSATAGAAASLPADCPRVKEERTRLFAGWRFIGLPTDTTAGGSTAAADDMRNMLRLMGVRARTRAAATSIAAVTAANSSSRAASSHAGFLSGVA